jgi:beta-carotene/zeaxanthin 4-ketolase
MGLSGGLDFSCHNLSPMSLLTVRTVATANQNRMGLWFAIAILLVWLASLFELSHVAKLFTMPLSPISVGNLSLFIFVRTFAQTGLFVIAHDAMHRTLVPQHRWLNDKVGALALGLYACLPYYQCRVNHSKHHQNPAQVGDPDFHDGVHSHPLLWYIRFLKGYLSWQWLVRFGLYISMIGFVSSRGFSVSVLPGLLLWLLPLSLSSLQLFFFGTYLPHRQGLSPRVKPFQGKGRKALNLWSLLSCYHFGYYHWEHHQSPQIPWYRLPTL